MAVVPQCLPVPSHTIILRWQVPAPGEPPAPFPPPAPPPAPPLLPPEIQGLVAAALAWQARRWQRAGEPKYDLSLPAAQTLWEQSARETLPDAQAERMSAAGLCERLSVEVERAVRVLAGRLQPGLLDAEMRAAALAGICRRIGQVFRAFCRRFDWAGALTILWQTLVS